MKLALSTLLALSAATLSLASPLFPISDVLSLGTDVVAQGLAKTGGDGGMRTMDEWHYVDCGTAGDVVQLKSIKVSPDPPVPGETLTVTVEADVLEVIEEGAYADVLVKLGLIKLLQKRFDICEEAQNANATVQCPVAPGPYEVTQSVDLPKEIPHAKFQVQLRGFNYDDKDLLCADIFIDFMKGRKSS